MSRSLQPLRKHLTVRPRLLAVCLFGAILMLISPVFGSDGTSRERSRYHLLYDDIGNTVNPLAGIELPDGLKLPGSVSDGDGNNGHGDDDGRFDPSNPGRGHPAN
ncbi:hypothetical protein [Haliangium sp.]|uniref:hypothetical protein n=1 Tax=Haliangium sp. TaxID=2663208 RepID=UPI003D0CED25